MLDYIYLFGNITVIDQSVTHVWFVLQSKQNMQKYSWKTTR